MKEILVKFDIKQFRQDRCLTQDDVAKAGVHKVIVSRTENNYTQVSLDTIRRIVKHFNLSTKEIKKYININYDILSK